MANNEAVQLKTSMQSMADRINNGKSAIATSITNQGVTIANNKTLQEYATAIGQIQGGDYSIGDTIFGANLSELSTPQDNQEILITENNYNGFSNMTSHKEWIYYTGKNSNVIKRISTKTKIANDVINLGYPIYDFLIENEYMYYKKNAKEICRLDINGQNEKTLVKISTGNFRSIEVDDTYLYYGQGNSIYKYKLDLTGDKINILTNNNLSATRRFKISNGYMYLSLGGTLHSLKLSDNTLKQLGGVGDILDMYIYKNLLYNVNGTTTSILQNKMDGTNNSTFINTTDNDKPLWIEVVGNNMYWVCTDKKYIKKCLISPTYKITG